MDPVIIIGAGPAGLAAAYELALHSVPVVVLELLPQVGGLSRTIRKNGAYFDIGGHRFFAKNQEVFQLWSGLLQEDLLTVPRLSRIFYNNKFFNYPFAPINVLFGFGPFSTVQVFMSYLLTRIRERLSPTQAVSFEDWVMSQFGPRLFEAFFKTYAEKVWGIPCSQIGADWAGQRIKGLSLWTAVMDSVFKPKHKKVKTPLVEFVYPRLGAGMFYERMAEEIERHGGQIILNKKSVGFRHEGDKIRAVIIENSDGTQEELAGSAFLASSPLTEGILGLKPEPGAEVLEAARGLRYRSHICVDFLVEGNPFPDSWIYVHSRDVNLARITNFRNFSEAMVGTSGLTPITVEYFCFVGDHLWSQNEAELITLAKTELKRMKLIHLEQLHSGFTVRNEIAYPVIELGYEKKVAILRNYIASFKNFHPIGRGGMFKYNNMDHAIVTGLLAARNVMGSRYDVWLVNIDAEYLESGEVLSSNQSR